MDESNLTHQRTNKQNKMNRLLQKKLNYLRSLRLVLFGFLERRLDDFLFLLLRRRLNDFFFFCVRRAGPSPPAARAPPRSARRSAPWYESHRGGCRTRGRACQPRGNGAQPPSHCLKSRTARISRSAKSSSVTAAALPRDHLLDTQHRGIRGDVHGV